MRENGNDITDFYGNYPWCCGNGEKLIPIYAYRVIVYFKLQLNHAKRDVNQVFDCCLLSNGTIFNNLFTDYTIEWVIGVYQGRLFAFSIPKINKINSVLQWKTTRNRNDGERTNVWI